MSRKCFAAFLMVVAFWGVMPSLASATQVDLELVLLVDVSGSIDSIEFNLQKTGYVNAFNSATLVSAIQQGHYKSIAATLVYWSSSNQQQQAVGWSLISDTASAAAFASAINTSARPFSDFTAPGSAINYAANSIGLFTNNYDSTRQVIDVSGDGSENEGASTSAARDAALAAGVDQINGLPIGGGSLNSWYASNVQGGSGSFTIPANTFADFGTAIQDKLEREVTGSAVPEPGTYLLLLTGLAGFGVSSWRKRRAA